MQDEVITSTTTTPRIDSPQQEKEDRQVKALAKTFALIAEMQQKGFTLMHMTRVELPPLMTGGISQYGYEVSFRKLIED